MTLRKLKITGTVVAATAATLGLLGAAHPAAANAPSSEASFFTGAQQSGTETAVDLDTVGTCQTLSQAALSGINLSTHDIDVFYRPNCETGTPSAPGDTYYVLGSLHTGSFSFPALSYRVQPAA